MKINVDISDSSFKALVEKYGAEFIEDVYGLQLHLMDKMENHLTVNEILPLITNAVKEEVFNPEHKWYALYDDNLLKSYSTKYSFVRDMTFENELPKDFMAWLVDYLTRPKDECEE